MFSPGYCVLALHGTIFLALSMLFLCTLNFAPLVEKTFFFLLLRSSFYELF